MSSFENVWRRIRAHEGETFYTIQQREFTYSIEKDRLFPSRTVYCIAKSNFKIAYRMVPIDGPGIIASDVRGPSYVWAILHDKRITNGEW